MNYACDILWMKSGWLHRKKLNFIKSYVKHEPKWMNEFQKSLPELLLPMCLPDSRMLQITDVVKEKVI